MSSDRAAGKLWSTVDKNSVESIKITAVGLLEKDARRRIWPGRQRWEYIRYRAEITHAKLFRYSALYLQPACGSTS